MVHLAGVATAAVRVSSRDTPRCTAGVLDWRKGAITEPLDGGALTLGVDARAGEGARDSATIFSELPWAEIYITGSAYVGRRGTGRR